MDNELKDQFEIIECIHNKPKKELLIRFNKIDSNIKKGIILPISVLTRTPETISFDIFLLLLKKILSYKQSWKLKSPTVPKQELGLLNKKEITQDDAQNVISFFKKRLIPLTYITSKDKEYKIEISAESGIYIKNFPDSKLLELVFLIVNVDNETKEKLISKNLNFLYIKYKNKSFIFDPVTYLPWFDPIKHKKLRNILQSIRT